MSWLSQTLRRLFGSAAYEQAKRRLTQAALSFLWDEAEPWIADLLARNGLARNQAQALAAQIVERVAARMASL